MLARSFFYKIIIKVAGNQDRHKSSVEFDFGPNRPTHFGVTCPWVTKISHIWTWIPLKPVGQSWSNFMCSIIGMGERLHKILEQIGSNFWFPWQRKAPIDLLWGKWYLHFLRLFLIRSFLYLQITRTCIKSWMSSNFSETVPLTTEPLSI